MSEQELISANEAQDTEEELSAEEISSYKKIRMDKLAGKGGV